MSILHTWSPSNRTAQLNGKVAIHKNRIAWITHNVPHSQVNFAQVAENKIQYSPNVHIEYDSQASLADLSWNTDDMYLAVSWAPRDSAQIASTVDVYNWTPQAGWRWEFKLAAALECGAVTVWNDWDQLLVTCQNPHGVAVVNVETHDTFCFCASRTLSHLTSNFMSVHGPYFIVGDPCGPLLEVWLRSPGSGKYHHLHDLPFYTTNIRWTSRGVWLGDTFYRPNLHFKLEPAPSTPEIPLYPLVDVAVEKIGLKMFGQLILKRASPPSPQC